MFRLDPLGSEQHRLQQQQQLRCVTDVAMKQEKKEDTSVKDTKYDSTVRRSKRQVVRRQTYVDEDSEDGDSNVGRRSRKKGKTCNNVNKSSNSGGGKKTPTHGNENNVGSGSGSGCLLYTSPSPRDQRGSRMPSSA